MENIDNKTTEEQDTPPVTTHLKWFNVPKGFGFVVPEDRAVDAFLHITTLQKTGLHAVGEGAVLECKIDYGPKGAIVTEITEVIEEGVLPESMEPEAFDEKNDAILKGTVKWYKPDKGFGFIVPEDGMKDVFVHKTCLDRHGIGTLMTGQKVKIAVRPVDKGRETLKIEIDNDDEA